MRRAHILIVVVITIAAASACHMPDYPTHGIADNPFLSPIDLTEPGVVIVSSSESGLITEPYGEKRDVDDIIFPVITDVHVGKSGVRPNREAFYDFLDNGEYPFAISLGDMSDSGDYTKDGTVEFIRKCQLLANGHIITTVGNHDRFRHLNDHFDSYFGALVPDGHSPRIGRYVYGPLSIYQLDNSARTYGEDQLRWLEEALKTDDSAVKIIVAHENHMSGGALDGALFMTGITDIWERNELLRLMTTYGVSLMLTGHYHDGGLYRMGAVSEYNLMTLTGKITPYRDGHWYTVEVDLNDNEIRVTSYIAETGEPEKTETFPITDITGSKSR